jgi:proliferating cell nuclear antigen
MHIETENGAELKTIFEILKDVTPEIDITFIKGDQRPDEPTKIISDDDNEPVQKKRGRKPKKLTEKKDSDDETDDDNSKHKKKASAKEESNEEEEEECDDEEKEDVKSNVNKPLTKTNGGMRILTFNDRQSLLVHVKLDSINFPKFYVDAEEHTIGMSLIEFYNFLKSIDKDGVLSMYINKSDKNKIVVDVDSNSSKTNYKLKLLDTNKRSVPLPPPQYDIVVTMDTGEFHKICNDLSQISNFMGITCTANKIEFSSQGDCAEVLKEYKNGQSVKILPVDNKEKDGDKKKKPELKIVKETYELKYLLMFRKCVNICKEVKIYLGGKKPMYITYTIASLGKMTIGLSPIIDNTNSNASDVEEDNDKYYNTDKLKMKKITA